ncbi:MAG: hypothetical protein KGM98_10145 [Bacteroidota bacterium]|nr:hypothetical protein [Bacteroidota bacterium]
MEKCKFTQEFPPPPESPRKGLDRGEISVGTIASITLRELSTSPTASILHQTI